MRCVRAWVVTWHQFAPETFFWPAQRGEGGGRGETRATTVGGSQRQWRVGGRHLGALEFESRCQQVVVDGEQLGVKVKVLDLQTRRASSARYLTAKTKQQSEKERKAQNSARSLTFSNDFNPPDVDLSSNSLATACTPRITSEHTCHTQYTASPP